MSTAGAYKVFAGLCIASVAVWWKPLLDTFTLATAAPDESVTVPSKVALTACPMTGADNPKNIVPSSTAMLSHHTLTRPAVTGATDSLIFIA